MCGYVRGGDRPRGRRVSAHSAAPQAAPSQSSSHGILNNLPLRPADPFAGTPADHWANGAAGIVTPTAGSIGGYTAAQVEFAYQTTRKLLIAANLNRPTLLGGRPTGFADLLSNDQRRQFLDGLDKTGLDKQGEAVGTIGMVTSFAPGGTRLTGDMIKVRGTMRVRAGKDSYGAKVLYVDIDYIFVYPIEPPQQPTRWMRVVYIGSVAGIVCGTTDGYVHPAYPSNAPAGAQPTASPAGTAIDPYAMGNAGSSGCHPTTGT